MNTALAGVIKILLFIIALRIEQCPRKIGNKINKKEKVKAKRHIEKYITFYKLDHAQGAAIAGCPISKQKIIKINPKRAINYPIIFYFFK